jgi:hypothetical protein
MVRRGSTVRVRQRALQRPRKTGSFVFGPAYTLPARSGVESVLEKRVLRRIPSRRLMERALEDRAMFDGTQKRASGAGTPWPGHRKGAPMQGKRMRGESAKQVAIDVLRAAGEPLHTKEITKRVIESGRSSGLKGKTPEATVAAMLAVGSKPGGSFKRVEKATYTLADDLAKSASAKPKKPEAKPRPKRPSGNARKRTSRNAQTAA